MAWPKAETDIFGMIGKEEGGGGVGWVGLLVPITNIETVSLSRSVCKLSCETMSTKLIEYGTRILFVHSIYY